jgi:hypothetical protein
MYKKRFAKWGFHKNAKRSATTIAPSDDRCVYRSHIDSPDQLVLLPQTTSLNQNDSLMLLVLHNIRTCGDSFFESVQLDVDIPRPDQTYPEETQEVSFAFKLVTGLLDRGYGALAGRLARKAFLLVENILMIGNPALIWNLLDVLHHTLKSKHFQLFHMLLGHVIALLERQFTDNHPLPNILRGFRGLAKNMVSTATTPGDSLPATPSSHSSASSTSETDVQTLFLLLERAWQLNAEMLFDRFDDRLFYLYCRVHWESCSLVPPEAIIDAADKYLDYLNEQQTYQIDISLVEDVQILQQQFVPERMDLLPIPDYEVLRISSIAAIRRHMYSIRGSAFADKSMLLRSLASLVTAKTFEEWPENLNRSPSAKFYRALSHGRHAGHVACAVKTLMHLHNLDDGDGLEIKDYRAVERCRSIVALREYAHGEADPQVIREMWSLEETLLAAGEYEEARKVVESALRRVEQYIQDIPMDSPT